MRCLAGISWSCAGLADMSRHHFVRAAVVAEDPDIVIDAGPSTAAPADPPPAQHASTPMDEHDSTEHTRMELESTSFIDDSTLQCRINSTDLWALHDIVCIFVSSRSLSSLGGGGGEYTYTLRSTPSSGDHGTAAPIMTTQPQARARVVCLLTRVFIHAFNRVYFWFTCLHAGYCCCCWTCC